MSNRKEEKIIHESQGVFLDPQTCGSSVRWSVDLRRVTRSEGENVKTDFPDLDTTVSFTDCSRSVTWRGHDKESLDTQIKKVARAIDALVYYKLQLTRAKKIMKDFKSDAPPDVDNDDLVSG